MIRTIAYKLVKEKIKRANKKKKNIPVEETVSIVSVYIAFAIAVIAAARVVHVHVAYHKG
jgi:hypothetical protein